MSDEKVIIEVGLNENQLRRANPNVAYTPEEIAVDARRCLDAGASVVHFHARDPITGEGTGEVGVNIETQRRVTETTSLIAYPTYADLVWVCDGYSTTCSPAEIRFRHFVEGVKSGVRFEVCPIDLGAFYDMNAVRAPGSDEAGIEGWRLTRGHQVNNGFDHLWLTRFAEQNGLQKAFAAPDTMCLLNLRNLIDMGMVPEPHLSLKLFFWSGTALNTRFQAMLSLALELFTDKRLRWMPVVQGADGLPLAAQALAVGGDVRTGIGDFNYADQGAPTNAALVERVVAMASALGREPASPDEARAIKGIAPLGERPEPGS